MAKMCRHCWERGHATAYCPNRACKWCGESPMTHLEFTCKLRPIDRKPISRIGKQTKKWQKTRSDWIKEHPFPFYICHYCGRGITTSEMTLDHMESRSRRPDLRHDFDNLVPSCARCNGLKGSLSHEQYDHVCHV